MFVDRASLVVVDDPLLSVSINSGSTLLHYMFCVRKVRFCRRQWFAKWRSDPDVAIIGPLEHVRALFYQFLSVANQ